MRTPSCKLTGMGVTLWHVLGASIDLVHALLMAAWVLGLPLLFVRRLPRWTRAYGIYAIGFILVSQGSRLLLGECFLTTFARSIWRLAPQSRGVETVADDWFTVRLAAAVFHLAPSHRAIVMVSDALVFVTAAGALLARRRLQAPAGAPPERSRRPPPAPLT